MTTSTPKEVGDNDNNEDATVIDEDSSFTDNNNQTTTTLQPLETSILMEKIVATRVDSHYETKAAREQQELSRRQQLQEQIQQVQAQLEFKKRQQRENTDTTSLVEDQNKELPFDDVTGATTTASLAEQESLLLINKIVAARTQPEISSGPLRSLQEHAEIQPDVEEAPQQQQQEEEPPQEEEPSRLQQVFPGAVRVRGIDNDEADDDDFSSRIESRSKQSSVDSTAYSTQNEITTLNGNDEQPILSGIHTDVEQAQIRQEIIQQAPMASVQVAEQPKEQEEEEEEEAGVDSNDDDDDTGRKNRFPVFLGIGLLLLTGCMIVILRLLLVDDGKNKKESSSSSSGKTTSPNSSPTKISTTCPCSFDLATFQVSEEEDDLLDSPTTAAEIVACGPIRILREDLPPGEFGAGICQGAGCLHLFPNNGVVDFDKRACFTGLKDANIDDLVYSIHPESMPMLIETEAQLADCDRLINVVCPENR